MTAQRSDTIQVPRAAVRQAGAATALLVGLAVLGLLGYFLARALTPHDPLASAINRREYQAVFLTNGQVYFGSLTAPGGDFYYLRHVYYLTTQPALQSGRPPAAQLNALVNAFQGPEDLMVINRSQISFVENLRPDSKISLKIGSGSSP